MRKPILAVLGSPRKNGYSTKIAEEVVRRLESEGAEVETVRLRDMDMRPCTACDACRGDRSRGCTIDDDLTALLPKIESCGALLLSSPIYWFDMSAQMKLFVDRFYALNTKKTGSLKDKGFGLIFSYGEERAEDSGVHNAIRVFEDSCAYMEADLLGVVHGTEEPDRGITGELETKIADLADKLLAHV